MKDDESPDETWWKDAVQTVNAIQETGLKPNLLIIDHYSLDKSWENFVRNSVPRVMVIDDLANRPHDCDLLLDQNDYPDMDTRYNELVSKQCRQFIGPKYLLLRKEFHEVQKAKIKKNDYVIKRIFMFFGGRDPTDETTKAMESLKIIGAENLSIDLIVGQANHKKEQLKKCSLQWRMLIITSRLITWLN